MPQQFVRWSHNYIKTGCLFYDQGDRSTWEMEHHVLIVSRTLIFEDTLLDKYDKRQVEWTSRVHGIHSVSHDYILLM